MKAMPNQQHRIFIRMRDVVLGLFGAAQYQQHLGRIQLQKLIYLTDSISTLFTLLPPQKAHETYKHGPWDNAIQSAVDCLVFRGCAEVEVRRDTGDGRIACRYSISDSGRRWASKLIESAAGTRRWEATMAVCDRVNVLGWRRLRRLAYAEPTYVSARQAGFGQELRPYTFQDATSGALLEVMRMVLTPSWNNTPPKASLLVELFFEFLDRYDQQAQLDQSEQQAQLEVQEG